MNIMADRGLFSPGAFRYKRGTVSWAVTVGRGADVQGIQICHHRMRISPMVCRGQRRNTTTIQLDMSPSNCINTCINSRVLVHLFPTHLWRCTCWRPQWAGPWCGRASMGSHRLHTLWEWCICPSCLARRTPGRSRRGCHGCWPS